jgi:hypothetical protein
MAPGSQRIRAYFVLREIFENGFGEAAASKDRSTESLRQTPVISLTEGGII